MKLTGSPYGRRRYAPLALCLLLAALPVLTITSCHRWIRIQVTDPSMALVLLDEWEIPRIEDDLDRESLERAVRKSLAYLGKLPADRSFRYGPYRASVEEVRQTLLTFLQVLNRAHDGRAFARHMREKFLWFRAAGRDIFRSVLFTGYYEPILEGNLEPGGAFRYPLYRRPPDLLEIRLEAFGRRFLGQRIVGRLEGRRVIPYYSREEIDGKGALTGRGLELVWLKDPVDAFFLHIQGSGQVRFPDGRRAHVNYAGANGHPYRSIGRILIDQGAIPRQKMSMQAIREYLREHPDRMETILFTNPSYIFFRVVEEGPLGNLNVPLTPGRSIATDSRLFPKAGLAFIRTEQPILGKEAQITGWRDISRFALNQDTGGAIRGAGRVDLFCGAGPEAEMAAGHLQHHGSLYFLLLKDIRQLTAAH